MNVGDVVRVRLREGVAGQARRVVHVARWQEGELFRTLCELVIPERDGEILGVLAGMPCMTCTRILSLRSRIGGAAAELSSGVVGE